MLAYYIKCAWNLLYSYVNRTNPIVPVDPAVCKVNDYLYVVKLHGTYTEMGIKYGEMMSDILLKDMAKAQAFYYPRMPIASLEAVYARNKQNYNPNVMDYMRGIATGSGLPFKDILNLNLITELTDNHCILLSKTIEGKRLNLRTLDFGSPPLCQTLTVFHPHGRIPYATLQASFAVGAFTGISSEGVFFGESYYDKLLDDISYPVGMPFHHIAHRILSEARTVDEAGLILKNCNRQSNLELLIATPDAAQVFQSSKYTLKQVAYPGQTEIYSLTPKELQAFKRNKTCLTSLDRVIREFVPRTKSGEFHIMIYYNDRVYISVTTDVLQSYNNTFYEFQIKDLFERKSAPALFDPSMY